MAKAHDPSLKATWAMLHGQYKDKSISKSEMLNRHNRAVTELLEDRSLNTHYSAMANQLTLTASPLVDTMVPGNPGVSSKESHLVTLPYVNIQFWVTSDSYSIY